MAAFQYIAMDQQGKRSKGVVEADTPRQARDQLRERKLIAIDVHLSSEKSTAKSKSSRRSFSLSRAKGMRSAELCLVTRQMSTLLTAGIPLDEVLAGVAEQQEKSNVKSVLLGVRAKVMEGYTLAAGMAEFPSAFPRLYRTTVASGEKSGKLGQVLERLAEYTEKQQHIRRKVKQALIYPLLMTVVSIFVIFFMLMYVVPKIIDVFNQTNQVLPLSTTILLVISAAIKHYGLYILGAVAAGVYVFSRLMKGVAFKTKVHQFMLKLPLIARVIRTINGARFARTFGILTAASVPVLEAMNSSAQLVGPLPMRNAILQSVNQVREGSGISSALQKTGYFSPMFIHLLASGESSGQLESMLQKAAAHQEVEVEAIIEGSLTLFEPIMILVMGGVVMFIVLAIMLPIFSLDNFNG